ncbi:ATP-dependent rRNA helicase spb4 [Niveomyces insectorum RCEF 264]|uniref:ATP-dependent RNA helicase n=1 Tax=Niveomyces insectorum RCEF 264 TaxID=1081102 RepID=A0A167QAX1_9HYPO|nr:ATP-dependent rRNA helicase spb4 [Niveomyces insectorum RCEF 264]
MAPIKGQKSQPAKRTARSWAALGLPDWCLEVVTSMGFAEPTPSQAAAIPLFLANSDVVVEAPTGSGKSLAFLLPLAARLLRRFGAAADGSPPTPIPRGHVAAVVLAPTRELADQLHRVLLALLAFHPPTAAILPYVQHQQRAAGEPITGPKRKRSAPSLAANGLQIAGDDDEDNMGHGDDPTNNNNNNTTATALHTRRRPATTEAVLVPQLVVGGTAATPAADLARFVRQGSNVLVGTPGRLAAMLASRAVNATASFEALVLDEADRLLDLGFAADLQRILAFVPKQRRTFLCSASVNDAIGELIKVNLRNPKRVVVRVQTRRREREDGIDRLLLGQSASAAPAAAAAPDERKTPASLLNTYIVVPASHKWPALVQLLTAVEPRPLRTLVFLASCFSVKYFAAVLPAALPAGYTVLSLHGKLEPHVREKAFARFLATTSPCVLLTTDVASRGLDVPNVDLVVNIDPPTDPKTFLHRCGRTGRAGRRGLAVTMLRPGREADDYVPFLAVRQTPVERLGVAVPALASVAGATAANETDVGTSGPPPHTAEPAMALTRLFRQQVLADRALHQLGQRAFVSWARAFQEHQAGSIFRVADLDWVDLGYAWGLVRLPKMPELRAAGVTDRTLGLAGLVDVDAIPFQDKEKEKKRQAELAASAAAAAAAAADDAAGDDNSRTNRKKPTPSAAEARRKQNAPWSNKQDRETVRVARRDRKRRKREAERLAAMTPAERAEEEKVAAMVAEVRRRNEAAAAATAATAAAEEEFAGFD